MEPFPPVPSEAEYAEAARLAIDRMWGGDVRNVPGYEEVHGVGGLDGESIMDAQHIMERAESDSVLGDEGCGNRVIDGLFFFPPESEEEGQGVDGMIQ